MMLYAIGDLHLGIGINKNMDIFGEQWVDHMKKIEDSVSKLKKTDTLLILGDISWAIKAVDAKEDLKFLEKFECTKYLTQGNHDYWWSSTKKLNEAFNLNFIKQGYFNYGEYAICVTKGSVCPNDLEFSRHDEKIYIRECNRLENSLKQAESEGYKKFIVLLHYPPTNCKKEKSRYIEIIENYNVEIVLYAHLHGKENFNSSLLGVHNKVRYELVSSDYLNFKVKKIILI